MSRARFATRKARNNGNINKGVGHNIKKPNGKKKLGGKHTNIKPFGECPPSPKVKPADRVPSEATSPAGSETALDSGKRFFRSRDLNRKATVSMSKELKYQLTNGGLVRSPAPTRRGPYKNLPARPPVPAPAPAPAAATEQRDLLAAIEELDGLEPASPRPSTPTTPATPAGSLRLVLADSDEEVSTPRRSPRKHQRPTPGTSEHQRQTPGTSEQQRGAAPAPAADGTPLRRSPRKQTRLPPLPTAGTPTHAVNEGPTRLTLTPRRSPRKHQQPQWTQGLSPGPSPSHRTPAAVYDRLEEQLMLMEAGEDKENESPQRRKKKEERSKFYSIFYRKTDGQVETRGQTPRAPHGNRPNNSTRVPARPSDDGLEQLVIDAGQRQFGVITCSTCTLVYTIGDPEDEATHARHHTGYLGALNYPGWKREHEVGHFMDGRVLMVTPRDPAHAWRKVDSVLKIVDAELGFVGIGVRNKERSKVFFYIVERQIVGCLVAEPVHCGFAVLPRDGAAGVRAGVRCDTESRPCLVGVSRVWVHRDYRRRQLATRMVQAMKNHFAMAPLSWQDVAFSDPTPDGLEFAAGVTGSQEFLVYNQ